LRRIPGSNRRAPRVGQSEADSLSSASAAGFLGKGVSEKDRIWDRCPFDGGAILSSARNGAIAFFKVADQFGFARLSDVPQPARLRSSLGNRQGQERSERVLSGLRSRSSIDVH
jgi:hypothetical protein